MNYVEARMSQKLATLALFIITSEGSAAAGIPTHRAVTGRNAYELVQTSFSAP